MFFPLFLSACLIGCKVATLRKTAHAGRFRLYNNIYKSIPRNRRAGNRIPKKAPIFKFSIFSPPLISDIYPVFIFKKNQTANIYERFFFHSRKISWKCYLNSLFRFFYFCRSSQKFAGHVENFFHIFPFWSAIIITGRPSHGGRPARAFRLCCQLFNCFPLSFVFFLAYAGIIKNHFEPVKNN